MRHILLPLFFTILISCGNSSKQIQNGENIVVTDIQGNKVTLDKPAERVVCLFDPSVDVIYMLQAHDKLVGIPAETYFDDELFDYFKHIDQRILNKEIATPGSNELANIESIIQLNPDLVIAQQLPQSTILTLQQMNIPVYMAAANRYEDLVKEMKDISKLMGKEERGNHLISYTQNKLNDLQVRANRENSKSKKTVYFTWANGKIFSTTGRNSMMNDCLVIAGVDNACPSEIDKPNINPETLLDWNPDMIVMWNDNPDLFYTKKELANVKAIQTKQIHNLIPMFFYNPHTFKSLCAAIEINGWAYSEQNYKDKNEIKEVLKELYGKENGEKLIQYL